MRDPWPDELEACRIRSGDWASNTGDRHGAFTLRPTMLTVAFDTVETELHVIANAAYRESAWWEHASVSTPDRCPSWFEMCFVKNLFWGEEETVVQYHPPKSSYVNCHPNTLHLWRPTRSKDRMSIPPSILVGPK
jgi:hypothetical protein